MYSHSPPTTVTSPPPLFNDAPPPPHPPGAVARGGVPDAVNTFAVAANASQQSKSTDTTVGGRSSLNAMRVVWGRWRRWQWLRKQRRGIGGDEGGRGVAAAARQTRRRHQRRRHPRRRRAGKVRDHCGRPRGGGGQPRWRPEHRQLAAASTVVKGSGGGAGQLWAGAMEAPPQVGGAGTTGATIVAVTIKRSADNTGACNPFPRVRRLAGRIHKYDVNAVVQHNCASCQLHVAST